MQPKHKRNPVAEIFDTKAKDIKDFIAQINDATITQKRNLFIEKNQFMLDKVRKHMTANIASKTKDDDKYKPTNMLKGISKEDIMTALRVRAKKLENSFGMAVVELEKNEVILKEKIAELRDSDNKYLSSDSFEKAKNLALITGHNHLLITSMCGILNTVSTDDMILLSTVILASGDVSTKLGQLLPELECQGIDIKNLKNASKGIEEALDGVNNYELKPEN